MKTIVIGDLHIPFHDKEAVDKVIEFIKQEQPEELVINGDYLDMYEISRFDKNPKYRYSIAKEFEEGREVLRKIREAIPNSSIVFVSGNHEARVETFLINNAPQLMELPEISVAHQLDFKGFGIKHIYSGLRESFYDTGKGLLIGHWNRVSKHSAYTAKALLDDKGSSLIQAHSHRLGLHYRTHGDTTYQACDGGCLCDTNPSYMLSPNWQQGFVIVHWIDNDFILEPILIKNGKFVYGGKVY